MNLFLIDFTEKQIKMSVHKIAPKKRFFDKLLQKNQQHVSFKDL